MAERQSLYELIGLGDKASPGEIRHACEAARLALDAVPDSEEKHNRRAVLQHAQEVLNDRRQRAEYDRRRRDKRHTADLAAPTPRRTWPALLVLFVLGAAFLAWRHPVTEKPAFAVKTAPALAPLVTGTTNPSAISEDIAALLPPAAATAPPAVPTIRNNVQPTQPEKLPRPVTEAPHAATLMKIADSTFAIVGGVGFGSGVAIGRDKLLTNCHVIAPNVLKGPMHAVSAVTGAKTLITEAAFLITEDACVVHAPGLKAKPIVMGDAGRLARGTPIFNIGFADGRLIFSPGMMLGTIERHGQAYLVSSNYCDHGVSGGPLVDTEGRLVGLTSGGPADRRFCVSLMAETARRVVGETMIAIDAFPPNYLSNLVRRW